jgi:pyruvate dehydrogenase complex dehydrogenase (E1) component
VASLHALANDGAVASEAVARAVKRYCIDAVADAPWTR